MKLATARALTELEYASGPCLENLEYAAAEAYGAAWVTWCRTVARLCREYPDTFGGFDVKHDHAIEFADCHLALTPRTEAARLKFEQQPIIAGPTGTGLAVQVPGHLCPVYTLPMTSPAGFLLWLCGIV